MNFLLDTHIILWWLADDAKFNDKARAAIMEPTNAIFIIAVTAWEIAIKKSLGKLIASDNFEEEISLSGFEPLVIAGLIELHHVPHETIYVEFGRSNH